ncbi:eukaryotic protein [Linnemannia elongata AG-77]|uniref:Eukaryotic protein n=1 Tax=Linnemannia elongata AG-77 TaxID=1314771 RepID=A0A197KEP4_9FUNG|nr:eukaryotic protein [Linnemannia elongata AG-77]
MEAQIVELLPFLHDGRMEVRQIAIHNIVSFTTPSSEFFHVFVKNAKSLTKDLKTLVRDDTTIAHDALRSLINLSGEAVVCAELDDNDFIKFLIFNIIISKTNILSDLGCMLLSNMCKNDSIATKVLALEAKPVAGLTNGTTAVAQLADIFLKGTDKSYNPNCTYDFLASVFATLAVLPQGRSLLFTKDEASLSPLSKIVCFTEHPNLIRRGGCITTIKNASFAVQHHPALMDESDINVLPYILLPLCGPEEFDIDDMEGMPEDIQLLPPTKTREADAHLRETLLEGLILLTSTREGRDYLREKKTYPVIQKMHAAETVDNVQEMAERIVNMLMRDEGNEITEVKEDEDDDGISEV